MIFSHGMNTKNTNGSLMSCAWYPLKELNRSLDPINGCCQNFSQDKGIQQIFPQSYIKAI
jgi:hypothetical protein